MFQPFDEEVVEGTTKFVLFNTEVHVVGMVEYGESNLPSWVGFLGNVSLTPVKKN